MESLLCDKQDILEQLSNIKSKLTTINKLNQEIYDSVYDINKQINNELELEDIEMVEDVKEDYNHKETEKTLKAKSSKKIEEEPNKGYKDFYDINSRPNILI